MSKAKKSITSRWKRTNPLICTSASPSRQRHGRTRYFCDHDSAAIAHLGAARADQKLAFGLPSRDKNQLLLILWCKFNKNAAKSVTELLPAALGLKNGDAKIIKNAGGLVISAFDSAMRSLIVAIYELGVEEIMVVAHSHCGDCHMSYDHFHHEMIARGVTDETLDTIRKCGIKRKNARKGISLAKILRETGKKPRANRERGGM